MLHIAARWGIAFSLLLFTLSPSASFAISDLEPRANEITNAIERKYFDRYAEYPRCEEILAARTESTDQLLALILQHGIQSGLLPEELLQLRNQAELLVEESYRASTQRFDNPMRFVENDPYRVKPIVYPGHGLVEMATHFTTLRSVTGKTKKKGRDNIERSAKGTTMNGLIWRWGENPGDKITMYEDALSSTAHLIKDHRYWSDCWSRILSFKYGGRFGYVRANHPYVAINLGFENVGDAFYQFRVRPIQQIYLFPLRRGRDLSPVDNAAEGRWQRADEHEYADALSGMPKGNRSGLSWHSDRHVINYYAEQATANASINPFADTTFELASLRIAGTGAFYAGDLEARTLVRDHVALSSSRHELDLDQPFDEIQREIQERFDQRPYRLHAGFPMCEDVLAKNGAEVRETVVAAIDKLRFEEEHPLLDEMQGRLEEVYFRVPSKATREFNGALADLPKRPVKHPRDQGAGCFVGETVLKKLANQQVVNSTIHKSYVGDRVLSHTIAATPNERYHMPCWGEVTQLHPGKTESGDPYKVIDLGDHSAATPRELLRVTPMHRFFASRDGGAYSWQPSHQLQGAELFALDFSISGKTYRQGAVVEEVRSLKVADLGGCRGRDINHVYNLTIKDTATYFIGANESKGNSTVYLVHNTKMY